MRVGARQRGYYCYMAGIIIFIGVYSYGYEYIRSCADFEGYSG